MLTIERKAELFDYIASRLDEGKFVLSFGSSKLVYHDQRSPEELAEHLEELLYCEAVNSLSTISVNTSIFKKK